MEYHVRVSCYKQLNYTVLAKDLKTAKEKYHRGEYEDCSEGGPMDGETINEEWDEVN